MLGCRALTVGAHASGSGRTRRLRWRSTSSVTGYRLTPGHLQSFRVNGYLIVKDFLKQQEVDLLREALETDRSLQDQQIQLNDQNDGKTKFALWYMQRALNVQQTSSMQHLQLSPTLCVRRFTQV